MPSKSDTSGKMSGHFLAVIVAPKRDTFDQMSGCLFAETYVANIYSGTFVFFSGQRNNFRLM